MDSQMPTLEPRVYSYIRFSSIEQAQGHSLQRQQDIAQEWSRLAKMPLDEELRDEGISAFRGKHRKEGALGAFLKKVEAGLVAPGSILIVEALDRFSREEPVEAYFAFLSVLKNDVDIVTGVDGQRYSRQDISSSGKLFLSIALFELANRESARKSGMVGAAWKNKRALARKTGEPLTPKTPGWIRLVQDGKNKHFEVIEERAEIVRRIYRETAGGMGRHTIARRLTEEGVPAFGRAKLWHSSYVAKLLDNDGVRGTYHPHSTITGERVPDGDPIENFYPQIIDDQLWASAQEAMENRKNVGMKGRTGEKAASPFTNIAFCGGCGGPLVVWHPGESERRNDGTLGKKVICVARRRGLKCASPVRFEFIAAIEHILGALDVFQTSQTAEDITPQLQQEEAAVRAAIKAAQADQANLLELLSRLGRTQIDSVADRMRALEVDLDALKTRQKEVRSALRHVSQRQAGWLDHSFMDDVRSAYWALERGEDSDEHYLVRQRAGEIARRWIARIVFEVGAAPELSRGYWITPKSIDGRTPDLERTFLVPIADGTVWVLDGFYEFLGEVADGLLAESKTALETRKNDIKAALTAILAYDPAKRREPYLSACAPLRWFGKAWLDRSDDERQGNQRVRLLFAEAGEPVQLYLDDEA